MTTTCPIPIRHALLAMGTRFELVVHHEHPSLAHAAAEAAADEILRLHRLWSPFEPSSSIAHINQRAPSPVRVDRDTLDLLIAAEDLSRQTLGLFDPTLGALMKWWGFRGPIEDAGHARRETRPDFGMRHVHIDQQDSTVAISTPGVQLDLGAIAKGAALDAAANILREAGITSALLHAGTSSVLAIGTPPGADGWSVRVGSHAQAPTFILRDESLSVSSPSGRTIHTDQGELGHVLDPRTGEPAMGSALAAVVCAEATTADAWSTACLISGTHPPTDIARWAYVLP